MKAILILLSIISIQSLTLEDFLNLHKNTPNEKHHIMIGDSLTKKNEIPQIGENSNIVRVVPLGGSNGLGSGLGSGIGANAQKNEVHHFHHVIVHNLEPENSREKKLGNSLQNSDLKKNGFMSFEDFLIKSAQKKKEENVQNLNHKSLFEILKKNSGNAEKGKKIQPQIIHVVKHSDLEKSEKPKLTLMDLLKKDLQRQKMEQNRSSLKGQFIDPTDLHEMQMVKNLEEKNQKIDPEDFSNFNFDGTNHNWNNKLHPLSNEEIKRFNNFKPRVKVHKFDLKDFLMKNKKEHEMKNDFKNKPEDISEFLRRHEKRRNNSSQNSNKKQFLTLRQILNRTEHAQMPKNLHPLSIREILNKMPEKKNEKKQPFNLHEFLNNSKNAEKKNEKKQPFNLHEFLNNSKKAEKATNLHPISLHEFIENSKIAEQREERNLPLSLHEIINKNIKKTTEKRNNLTLREILEHSRNEEKRRNSRPLDFSHFLKHEKEGLRPLESHNGNSHTFNLADLLRNPKNPIALENEKVLKSHNMKKVTMADFLKERRDYIRKMRNEKVLESDNHKTRTVNLAELLRHQKPGVMIEKKNRDTDLRSLLKNQKPGVMIEKKNGEIDLRNLLKKSKIPNSHVLTLKDLQNLPNTNNKIHTMSLEDILNRKNHQEKLNEVLKTNKMNKILENQNKQRINSLRLNEILNRHPSTIPKKKPTLQDYLDKNKKKTTNEELLNNLLHHIIKKSKNETSNNLSNKTLKNLLKMQETKRERKINRLLTNKGNQEKAERNEKLKRYFFHTQNPKNDNNSKNEDNSMNLLNSINQENYMNLINSKNGLNSINGQNSINGLNSKNGQNSINRQNSLNGLNSLNRQNSLNRLNSMNGDYSLNRLNSMNMDYNMNGDYSMLPGDDMRDVGGHMKRDDRVLYADYMMEHPGFVDYDRFANY